MDILFVDDEPAIVDVMVRVLTSLGHQVVAARDGLEALDCYAAADFDVVISDIRMPRLDGPGLPTRLRARSPHPPVILISGVDDEIDRGAPDVAFLVKPVRLRDLLTCLEQIPPAGGAYP